MYSIDVDFDVYKKLTAMRETEAMTYNDVLRGMLALEPATPPEEQSSIANAKDDESTGEDDDWTVKGVRFTKGTQFRAKYKGKNFHALVAGGKLKFPDGRTFDSPSKAAVSITHNAVNGWRFWEFKFPGSTTWRAMDSLRPISRI